MLTIIQSNKVDRLFDHLLEAYKNPDYQGSIFEPFQVIVPSKVMGEWLKKQVADKAGISTLVTTEFWGRYFLSLMQRVLRTYARVTEDKAILEVPEVAMLSKNVMQWQIFGFLLKYQDEIIQNDKHALYPFLAPLIETLPLTDIQLDSITDHNAELKAGTSWTNNPISFANESINQSAQIQTLDQRIWQLASDMANMLNRYMTYRPQWLAGWAQNKHVSVTELIDKKDALHNQLNGRDAASAITTPQWLVEHYEQLEIAQRYLWQQLFEDDYAYREQLHLQFWQALTHANPKIANICRSKLPKRVYLFTLQQLPPTELLDLQRLGMLTNVTILHFNPSEQFWADIVDKTWLMQMQLEANSKQNNSLYLKDYGHTLLSRFGKQSREVFAMLASLSGNDYQNVEWQDDFDSTPPQSLLEFIQHDILMLEETATTDKINEMLAAFNKKSSSNNPSNSDQALITQTKLLQQQLKNMQSKGIKDVKATLDLIGKIKQESQKQDTEHASKWQTKQLDTSLAVHVCHSLVRQLEVLRGQIIAWLNYTDMQATPEQIPTNPWLKRAPSDILVLLPDIEAHQNLIEAVFPKRVGADGYQLPAKVTGVVAKDINQLWQAITGYYTLLNRADARFNRTQVLDWLLLPPLYESYGLNLEQMTRACDLLEQAGFIRGFDEIHLQQTLDSTDDDYRYTFAYALERLIAGVIMPNATSVSFGEYTNNQGVVEKISPLNQLTMADADIVAVLCDIYQTLDAHRYLGEESRTLIEWLHSIEELIQQKFSLFNQTTAWRAIFAAQNDLKDDIQANNKSGSYLKRDDEAVGQVDSENLPLKLNFVLENIAQSIINQQVSAEPSGVITFARFGAVRNLPYDLVVMLNLNLSEFPKQEQHNRYNLMQAGLPERGDRFREDDDLGAFLDGLLCAKQACWMFYNGKSTTDEHEYLPASPVQELLEFLQNRIDIENLDDFSKNSLSNKDKIASMEKIIKQYLVTEHAALPFDKSYFSIFEKKSNDDLQSKLQKSTAEIEIAKQIQLAKTLTYPPAMIWHDLHTALTIKNHIEDTVNSQHLVKIWDELRLSEWLQQWQRKKPNTAELTRVGKQQYVELSTIVKSFIDPAKAYAKAQNIFIYAPNEEDTEFEALTLDNLTGWSLRKSLLEVILTDTKTNQNLSEFNLTQPNALSMNELLPAGVNRYQALQQNYAQLTKDIQTFVAHIAYINQQLDSNNQNYLGSLYQDNFEGIIPDSEEALVAAAKSLTVCEEQRIALTVVTLDSEGMVSGDKLDWVITAHVPIFCQDEGGQSSFNNPKYWLNYLPTSGKEKYLIQFWLHHLCWQVLRRTNITQAKANDGFSLWQFSDKKTAYLPAIPYEQAYSYLQDVMMVYQLIDRFPTILPPAFCMDFLNKQQKKPELPSYKHIGEWLKKASKFHNVDVNNFDYPIWQQLIGDYPPTVIIGFAQTLGRLIYQPLQSMLTDVDKLTDN